MENPEENQADKVASVRVDRELCQTAAICLAYHVYELDDESKAVLLTNNGDNSDNPANPLTNAEGDVKIEDLLNPDDVAFTPQQMREMVLESAKLCPFNAIIVNDAEGNQIWPPL